MTQEIVGVFFFLAGNVKFQTFKHNFWWKHKSSNRLMKTQQNKVIFICLLDMRYLFNIWFSTKLELYQYHLSKLFVHRYQQCYYCNNLFICKILLKYYIFHYNLPFSWWLFTHLLARLSSKSIPLSSVIILPFV